MGPVFWDVLSVVVQTLLHYHVGAEYAWAVVFSLVSLCCVDRDLEVHEMLAAVFMLRSACASMLVRGDSAWVMAALVVLGCASSCTHGYLKLSHVFRRPFTCTLAASSVVLRYEWNVNPAVSVLHLALFNLITRYKTVYRAIDSWDAAAQSLWLLALPTQMCAIGLLLLLYEGRDTIAAQGGRRTNQTYQRTTTADTLV
jgi:hypothetical protein